MIDVIWRLKVAVSSRNQMHVAVVELLLSLIIVFVVLGFSGVYLDVDCAASRLS